MNNLGKASEHGGRTEEYRRAIEPLSILHPDTEETHYGGAEENEIKPPSWKLIPASSIRGMSIMLRLCSG